MRHHQQSWSARWRGLTTVTVTAGAAALVLAGCAADTGTTSAAVETPTLSDHSAAADPITESAADQSRPAATSKTPVPAGSVGSVDLATADTGDPVQIEQDVLVEVTNVDGIEVKAIGPGDIAGPGIKVGVRVTNKAATDVDLAGISVTAQYGDAPATPVTPDGEEQLSTALPQGKSATGTYLFRNPDDTSADLTIRVEYNRSQNVVVVQP